MKKITLLFTLLFTTLSATMGYAQSPKALVIGVNHLTNDGFAFVILENIPNGEVIYFTDREYNNGTNMFNTGEFVITFTASGAITAGTVVFLNEVSSNNLTVTCTGGGSCGSVGLSGSFSIGSDGDEFYAYADTDALPENGVTEIYSVMFTGVSGSPGGNIPALQDPTGDYPTAILVDGFPGSAPNRTEYQFSPASLRDGVSQANLENTSNYLHAQSNAGLSTVEFTNLNLTGADPALTVSRAPASVAENSGSGIVYTFTLASAAASTITINFNVSGTATFTTDYTQSGAASFNATSGTVVMNSGSTTTTVTLTPVGDATLEPDETAILSIAAGTGYDIGAPSSATGTFTNDDTTSITPDIAVVGTNHTGTEGFSFVALVDIAGSATYYFTENPFDNNLLAFSGSEAVVSWTAPAGGVTRGTVIVATETTANNFTVTCDGGTCGVVAAVSGNFDYATNGEAFFAYQDGDTDHTNGVTQVDAVLFTGTTVTPGGNIPTGEDPSSVYIGAVVVDGFAASAPNRTEYRFPPERGMTVNQADFQSTSNWFHAAGSATLDDTPFANIIISTGSANPALTLAVSPTITVEDSGTGMVYTFTLSAPAASAITVNFDVAGTATLTTDYTVSGADTFTATSGTATIPMGGTSVAVTITPVVDAIVEPTETVNLMIASGTGYDGGSPNSATGNITNDDTSASDPIVAVMGMSHDGPDGFSFVAAQDIPAGTVVYFTEDEFDNTTLLFSAGGEAVLQWTSPGGQIDQGDVITVTETTPDTFTIACSDTSGNGCGSIAVIVSGFSLGSDGETLTAYEDSDTDPTNGVTDIYSMMFTGLVGSPGGNLPPIEDPTGIYLNALVVDGFPNAQPVKTEYTPASRAITINQANFENPTNYDHAFSNPPALSTVSFADITIVDTNPPTAVCQDIMVQLDASGDASIVAADIDNGSSDAEGPVTLSIDIDTFDCSDMAAPVVVTLTVTDGAGNTDTCTANVTVEDNVAPTALCQDITVQLDANGDATITAADVDGGSNDACGIASLNVSPNTFDCTDVGNNTVTLTVTDNNGNTSTCTSTVTVEDNISPTALCQDVIVQLDATGNVTVPASSVENGSNDACGIASLSLSPNTFDCTDVGNKTVTLTATDNNGNTSTCTATVTVQDNVPPVALCQDVTVQLDAAGNATITAADVDNGSNDACGIASLAIDNNTFDCSNVGANTVTLTVTDNNGNTASCTSTVTVVDNVAPTALCQDITVQLDANGDASITAADVDGGSTDACGIASLAIDNDTFDCSNVGANTITLTVTDVNGNTSTCTANVTVEDNVAPTALCQDITVQLDATGNATITGADVDGGSTDACGVASLAIDNNTFDCSNVGPNTVTLTVTDTNANTSTCTSTVTVEDNIAPTAICQDITVQLDATGNATITATDIDNGSNDACGVASLAIDNDTFDCSNVGANTVTLTVTDVNGNPSICTANVTVEDITPPTAVCQDITVQLDANGDATITGADVDGGSNDACGIASLSVSPNTFDCTDVGANTVTLTVTDNNGNTASCTSTITVEDNVAPTALCRDITVQLDTNGNATITAADVDNGSNDACGVASLAIDNNTFDCSNVGANTVTLTVTDNNGNTASCTSTVTIEDNVPPTVTCPADRAVPPAIFGGTYTVPDYFAIGEGTATDNCSDPLASLTQDPAPGTELPDGEHTVTLCATDASGNETCCTFILEVDGALGVDVGVGLETVVLYPNPATDVVSLFNPNIVNIDEVAIYDLEGSLLQSINLGRVTSEATIDIGRLAPATYVLVFSNGRNTETRLLIKR